MVRIIVKVVEVPPLDAPARVRWVTVDLNSTELTDLFLQEKTNKYYFAEIVGGELLDVQA